jgi:hypothetical protein
LSATGRSRTFEAWRPVQSLAPNPLAHGVDEAFQLGFVGRLNPPEAQPGAFAGIHAVSKLTSPGITPLLPERGERFPGCAHGGRALVPAGLSNPYEPREYGLSRTADRQRAR